MESKDSDVRSEDILNHMTTDMKRMVIEIGDDENQEIEEDERGPPHQRSPVVTTNQPPKRRKKYDASSMVSPQKQEKPIDLASKINNIPPQPDFICPQCGDEIFSGAQHICPIDDLMFGLIDKEKQEADSISTDDERVKIEIDNDDQQGSESEDDDFVPKSDEEEDRIDIDNDDQIGSDSEGVEDNGDSVSNNEEEEEEKNEEDEAEAAAFMDILGLRNDEEEDMEVDTNEKEERRDGDDESEPTRIKVTMNEDPQEVFNRESSVSFNLSKEEADLIHHFLSHMIIESGGEKHHPRLNSEDRFNLKPVNYFDLNCGLVQLTDSSANNGYTGMEKSQYFSALTQSLKKAMEYYILSHDSFVSKEGEEEEEDKIKTQTEITFDEKFKKVFKNDFTDALSKEERTTEEDEDYSENFVEILDSFLTSRLRFDTRPNVLETRVRLRKKLGFKNFSKENNIDLRLQRVVSESTNSRMSKERKKKTEDFNLGLAKKKVASWEFLKKQFNGAKGELLKTTKKERVSPFEVYDANTDLWLQAFELITASNSLFSAYPYDYNTSDYKLAQSDYWDSDCHASYGVWRKVFENSLYNSERINKTGLKRVDVDGVMKVFKANGTAIKIGEEKPKIVRFYGMLSDVIDNENEMKGEDPLAIYCKGNKRKHWNHVIQLAWNFGILPAWGLENDEYNTSEKYWSNSCAEWLFFSIKLMLSASVFYEDKYAVEITKEFRRVKAHKEIEKEEEDEDTKRDREESDEDMVELPPEDEEEGEELGAEEDEFSKEKELKKINLSFEHSQNLDYWSRPRQFAVVPDSLTQDYYDSDDIIMMTIYGQHLFVNEQAYLGISEEEKKIYDADIIQKDIASNICFWIPLPIVKYESSLQEMIIAIANIEDQLTFEIFRRLTSRQLLKQDASAKSNEHAYVIPYIFPSDNSIISLGISGLNFFLKNIRTEIINKFFDFFMEPRLLKWEDVEKEIHPESYSSLQSLVNHLCRECFEKRAIITTESEYNNIMEQKLSLKVNPQAVFSQSFVNDLLSKSAISHKASSLVNFLHKPKSVQRFNKNTIPPVLVKEAVFLDMIATAMGVYANGYFTPLRIFKPSRFMFDLTAGHLQARRYSEELFMLTSSFFSNNYSNLVRSKIDQVLQVIAEQKDSTSSRELVNLFREKIRKFIVYTTTLDNYILKNSQGSQPMKKVSEKDREQARDELITSLLSVNMRHGIDNDNMNRFLSEEEIELIKSQAEKIAIKKVMNKKTKILNSQDVMLVSVNNFNEFTVGLQHILSKFFPLKNEIRKVTPGEIIAGPVHEKSRRIRNIALCFSQNGTIHSIPSRLLAKNINVSMTRSVKGDTKTVKHTEEVLLLKRLPGRVFEDTTDYREVLSAVGCLELLRFYKFLHANPTDSDAQIIKKASLIDPILDPELKDMFGEDLKRNYEKSPTFRALCWIFIMTKGKDYNFINIACVTPLDIRILCILLLSWDCGDTHFMAYKNNTNSYCDTVRRSLFDILKSLSKIEVKKETDELLRSEDENENDVYEGENVPVFGLRCVSDCKEAASKLLSVVKTTEERSPHSFDLDTIPESIIVLSIVECIRGDIFNNKHKSTLFKITSKSFFNVFQRGHFNINTESTYLKIPEVDKIHKGPKSKKNPFLYIKDQLKKNDLSIPDDAPSGDAISVFDNLLNWVSSKIGEGNEKIAKSRIYTLLSAISQPQKIQKGFTRQYISRFVDYEGDPKKINDAFYTITRSMAEHVSSNEKKSLRQIIQLDIEKMMTERRDKEDKNSNLISRMVFWTMILASALNLRFLVASSILSNKVEFYAPRKMFLGIAIQDNNKTYPFPINSSKWSNSGDNSLHFVKSFDVEGDLVNIEDTTYGVVFTKPEKDKLPVVSRLSPLDNKKWEDIVKDKLGVPPKVVGTTSSKKSSSSSSLTSSSNMDVSDSSSTNVTTPAKSKSSSSSLKKKSPKDQIVTIASVIDHKPMFQFVLKRSTVKDSSRNWFDETIRKIDHENRKKSLEDKSIITVTVLDEYDEPYKQTWNDFKKDVLFLADHFKLRNVKPIVSMSGIKTLEQVATIMERSSSNAFSLYLENSSNSEKIIAVPFNPTINAWMFIARILGISISDKGPLFLYYAFACMSGTVISPRILVTLGTVIEIYFKKQEKLAGELLTSEPQLAGPLYIQSKRFREMYIYISSLQEHKDLVVFFKKIVDKIVEKPSFYDSDAVQLLKKDKDNIVEKGLLKISNRFFVLDENSGINLSSVEELYTNDEIMNVGSPSEPMQIEI